MNERKRVRLGVEQLENRDSPAGISINVPFVRVNVAWFRRHPWAFVRVRAPFTRVAVLGHFVRVGIG